MKSKLAVIFVVALLFASHIAEARDQISVVGSSTVYPFTTTVAEQFGRGGKFKTPKVESTGTGGGIKLFCNGVGPQHADVANASRKMKAAEAQPPDMPGESSAARGEKAFDVMALSEDEFNALPAATLKRLRGDVV